MRCIHCGKTSSDGHNYCPYCAKPLHKPEKTIQEKYEIYEPIETLSNAIKIFFKKTLIAFFSLCPFWIINLNTINPILNFEGVIFLSLAYGIFMGIVHIVKQKDRTPREKMIAAQFHNDPTSICPKCGSHNIALGRKGYDWDKAFWSSLFGNNSGIYAAGMDSRKVTGYCRDCGASWETNREWIK